MKRQFHPKILIALAVLVALAAVWYLLFYRSKHGLEVSCYTVQAQVSAPVRIVQLSDLHNSTFGPDNQRLIDVVSAQNPDLIFLTGDLCNNDDPDLSVALNLIQSLSQVAPVYASYGNHELTHQETFHSDIRQAYTQAGATFLDFEWQEVEVAGSRVRIGGVYGYCLSPKYLNESNQNEYEFLSDFQDTSLPTLLLCHLPLGWMGLSLEDWDVDVIFSGHFHGGQVILPGLGGLYAPDMGWFPGRLWGTYTSANGQHTLVLSRGLGTSEATPRCNNVPEVVVADLIPKGM